MADDPNLPPVTPPLPNDPAARTADGTLKDLAATAPDPKSTTPPAKSDTTDPAAKDPKDATLAAGDKKPVEPQPVPDKYEFKAPEGYEIDAKVVEEATPILKELGIPQEGAQKLFDLFAKHSTESQTALIDAFETMRQDWRKEIIGNRELGNGKAGDEGGLAPEVSANIAAAIDSVGPALASKFRDAMNLTGAGDHPAFVEAMNLIGKVFREGKLVAGGKPSPLGQKAPGASTKPTPAQALYPNLASSANQ